MYEAGSDETAFFYENTNQLPRPKPTPFKSYSLYTSLGLYRKL
jgi:hypothetical protein